ncbi:MAG: putative DNA binding domain-containing protein [Oscillospiraceae bacterium]|nr:putative DNA binding domain-containing protein [Oscillospiraceae bacterium]
MKLSDFIGETTEYDKKEMLEERKPKSWLKSVSAFANGIGGALIFGVSDDETLVGLDDAKDASEKISEAIKTKMDPIPDIVLKIHKEDGKEFVVLDVKSGMETPYYYIGDGGHIAFVRVGNESIPADATALKRLVMKGSNITFDSISTRYNFSGFAFTKLRSVYRQRTKKELSESDFASFGLVDEDGMLTNAGALLADESPIRHSRLFCTRWYGLDKASGIMEALDDREVSGSLITLLQAGEEFVNNNTKKRWKKTGNGRIEMPEYPERAVLECIVNALIHRDYSILGSEVHIDIFDDRIEITSPGGMPDGSAVQNLDTDNVISKRRNPVIADVFSRMNYMERRGSGFKKIKDDYHFAVNYRPELEPKFYSDISTFKVTLYNLNYNVPVEKVLIDTEKVSIEEEKVLITSRNLSMQTAIDSLKAKKSTKENARKLFAYMEFDGIFGRTDIMEITGLSITAAGNLLTNLKSAELIAPVSGYGNGKYKFIIPKE